MGWGWVIVHNGEVVHAGYGGGLYGTNNVAEMMGAIEGLTHLLKFPIVDHEGITLISDSRYALGMASGEYTPKKNIEIAKFLKDLGAKLKINCLWVKGHNGNQMNEIVDSLAGLGKRKYKSVKVKKHKKKRK